MGHESQIELWSPNLTTFCFVGFGTDRLRRQEAMKTAGKENPNRCAITRQPTELLGRKLKLSLLNQVGWKARKHPATAKYFFLYRTTQEPSFGLCFSMLISTFFFHGEQLIVWFFALLRLLTFGLVWFTVWLVRKVKRRIGNRAYWLAPIPFVLVLPASLSLIRCKHQTPVLFFECPC